MNNTIQDKVLNDKLNNISSDLVNCSMKIKSSTKFVDFFVHDILDYTILNKKDKIFMPNITIFDIRDAINEINEILEGKIQMKNIVVKIEYKEFYQDDAYLMKTDQKRLQQILLNLYSNAIKFTDRDGKICIQVEIEGNQLINNRIKISVIDSGIGIKEENKSKLFQLFGSIKDKNNEVNT